LPGPGCWRVPALEEKHVADLYVAALDLCTGQVVEAGDRQVWEWRKKGHNGDATLVCLECYQGADRPDGPRAVPLVPPGAGRRSLATAFCASCRDGAARRAPQSRDRVALAGQTAAGPVGQCRRGSCPGRGVVG
jgi:hypothetical protein